MIHGWFKKLSIEDQNHSRRVAELSLEIADQIILTQKDVKIDREKLEKAALYHDLGKIMVDQNILNKSGSLTKREKDEIMLHAKYSSQLILKSGLTKDIAKIAMLHHENCDGTGYPFKLYESEIPFESRIIRVSDVFDALCSRRSYKMAFDTTEALGIIEIEKSRYDIEVTKALKCVIKQHTQLDKMRITC